MNLNFHQTFKPEKKHITELIILASNNPSMTIDEISLATGIPQGKSSGKVIPHLEYARFMGIVNFELKNGLYSLSLTDLGQLILDEDIGLSESITLLLLHSMLIRASKGADLWNFCFTKFVKKYGNTTKYGYFENEVNNNFNCEVNLGPLKCSYSDFFTELNFLVLDKNSNLFQVNSINYDSEYDYLYAYVLYEYWDILFPLQDEISADEFDKLDFGKCFGISHSEELNILEKISELNLIRINKQLMPFTILKLSTKEQIVTEIYSNLI